MHNIATTPTTIPTVAAVDNWELACDVDGAFDAELGKLVAPLVEPVIFITLPLEVGVEIAAEGSEDVKLIIAPDAEEAAFVYM